MNANEVIAHLAARSAPGVHPNDHVNMGQSSNDAIPTAIHVSAALLARESLLPALEHLAAVIAAREADSAGIVKTGRTHLMDAMPVTLAQELSGWRTQIENGAARVRAVEPRLLCLAQGGTAVGTGINADPRFGAAFCQRAGAAHRHRLPAEPQLLRIAVGAGHRGRTVRPAQGDRRQPDEDRQRSALDEQRAAGRASGEIALPALQPGSSIMPGKVNPVIPEAVAMVAAEVIGNDAAITVAGQSGNFQLNVMLPLIAWNLLESLRLLANVARLLADSAIAGFTVNRARLAEALERNPILVTALNPVIGYEKGAAIAKRAYAEGKPIREVAAAMTDLPPAELAQAARSRGARQGRHQGRQQRRRLVSGSMIIARRLAGATAPLTGHGARPRSGSLADGRPADVRRVPGAARGACRRRHARRRCWCRSSIGRRPRRCC